jgi:hypothetical protein
MNEVFDNDVTKLYKQVDMFNMPAKYIIPDVNAIGGYTTLIILITEKIIDGDSLYNISSQLTTFVIDDIVYSYVYSIQKDPEMYEFSRETIFADIVKFYDKIELSNLTPGSYEDLDRLVKAWIVGMAEQLNNDRTELAKMIEDQTQLGGVVPFSVSPVVFLKTTFEAYPTFQDGKNIEKSDGPDIFNKIVLDQYVPFVIYNGQESSLDKRNMTSLYKVFPSINMEHFVERSRKKKSQNTIYLFVWGKDSEPPSSPPKASYNIVEYNLETGFLTFESLNNIKDKMVERISKVLPFEIGEVQDGKLSSTFNVYRFDEDEEFDDLLINVPCLLHTIMNNSVFKTYFYIEEKSKLSGSNQIVKIKFRTYTDINRSEKGVKTESNVSFTLQYSNITPESKYDISSKGPDGESITIQKIGKDKDIGKGFLVVDVKQAISSDIVFNFVVILSHALSLYFYDYYYDIYKEYSELLDISGQFMTSSEKLIPKKLEISTYRQNVPNTPSDLAKRCLKSSRPFSMNKKEAEEYEKEDITVSGVVMKKQSMEFPTGSGFYYVCNNNSKSPFPGLKVAIGADGNLDFFPCCYNANQRLKSKDKNKSLKALGAYEEGPTKAEEFLAEKKQGKKQTRTGISSRLLKPGHKGKSDDELSHFVTNFVGLEYKVFRLGVDMDKNSFLHAIVSAVDPNYLQTENKEEYVKHVRLIISTPEIVKPSTGKQEMYDMTLDQIEDAQKDLDSYYDPLRFVHIVEEYYNINIFFFETVKDEKSERVDIAFPRHKIFHVRSSKPERRTVLIMLTTKNTGEKVSELIVYSKNELSPYFSIYEKELTLKIQEMINMTTTVISWSIDSESTERSVIEGRKNIYNQVDYSSIFSDQAKTIAQYIDSNGKVRGFRYQSLDNMVFDLVVPPSQPRNLDVITEMCKTTADVVLSKIANPVAKNKDGLWFSVLDIKYGVFAPCVGVEFLSLPEGPRNNIHTQLSQNENKLTIKKTDKLRKDFNIFVQILTYLFSIFMLQHKQEIKIKAILNPDIDFYNNHLAAVVGGNVEYTFNNIPRKLMKAKTVNEALLWLSGFHPNIFVGDKFAMENVNLAGKALYFIKKMWKQSEGSTVYPQTTLHNFYALAEDFEYQSGVVVLTSTKEMENFHSIQKNGKIYKYKEFTSLNKSMIDSKEPIIYRRKDGSIYLIQSTLGNTFNRSMTVALRWYTEKINIGYTSDEISPMPNFSHIIYQLDNSNNITVDTDNSIQGQPYLEFLKFDSRLLYAAMLKIL